MDKYISDPSSYIKFIDSNVVFMKTSKGRFKINGFGISDAIQNIINIFSVPISLDQAILALKNKYNEDTLIKTINLMVNKRVIVKESEVQDLQNFDRTFVEKNRYYTLEGKTLTNIVEDLGNIRIGVLGNFLFSECILHNFERGGLLTKFNVLITDRDVLKDENIKNNHKTIVYNNSQEGDMESLIENSDLLVVSSSFKDNYLFNLVNKICIEKSKKWLRVLLDGQCCEVGPLFIPGETCCYSCMDMREMSNMSEETHIFDNILRNMDFHNEQLKRTIGLYCSYPLNILTSDIAYYELINYLVGVSNDLLDNVLRIIGEEHKIEKERIFRYSDCPVCH